MTPKIRISRRGFLKLSCLTAAAAGSAVCGVTLAAPALPPIELQSITNEGVNMKKRVLVTYATYADSTIDVAVAISEKLTAQGLSVDVKPVNENPQIDNYQAVLIGSAVQHANWLPEAVDFVTAQQDASTDYRWRCSAFTSRTRGMMIPAGRIADPILTRSALCSIQ